MSPIAPMGTLIPTAPREESSGHRLTPVQWLICAVACLGFAFDLYESLMLPLIIRPVITSLSAFQPGSSGFNLWVGLLFYIPNAMGGIFGLLGGYLADWVGRRRILVWSILLYGLAACLAAFSSSLVEFLILRCLTMIGVCVEFVAAIAWLAELFPSPKQRESVLSITQAFHCLGGLMVAGAYFLAVTYADVLPALCGGHLAWRYTLLSGLFPAIPLFLLRPLLPESPLWRETRVSRQFRRPSFSELFQPALKRTTLVTTALVACSSALAFGAIQQATRMVPGLPGVHGLPPKQIEHAVSALQLFQELGGLVGRVIFIFLVVRIVSQRRLLRCFFLLATILFPCVFFLSAPYHLLALQVGIFSATLLFNANHSFWGNYLPRVYPTHLRATGESFAVNVGARILGVSAAFWTANLSSVMPGTNPSVSLAYSAGLVATVACLTGLWASRYLSEPRGRQLWNQAW
jgi:MFS family permease